MDLQLRFKPCFQYEIVPEGVFLLTEQSGFLLKGAAYAQLAPYLDGQHNLTTIITNLQAQFSPLEIFHLLDNLQQAGYVTLVDNSLPPQQAAFWQLLNVESSTTVERLQEQTVAVMAVGNVEVSAFTAILQTQGIQISESSQYWVVLTDDYLQDELDHFNQTALRQQYSWLLVKPVGAELWIGPLFIPGQTACWQCLKQRLQGNRPLANYLRQNYQQTQLRVTSLSLLPSTLQTALNIAATETAKWLVNGRNPSLENKVVTFNTLNLEKQDHHLVRRPQCPHCGNPQQVANSQWNPLTLSRPKKICCSDGGYRSTSPEQTWAQFSHHISPITGIIRSLKATTTNDNDSAVLTPAYRSIYQFENEQFSLAESLHHSAYGKGKQPIQAQVSALCEAIERYAGVFQGDEARIRARLTDLPAPAILPNTIMGFSQQQFANRPWGHCYEFNWIPEPFDDTSEIEWSPVWSLTHNEPRYVATAYCYYNYSQKHQIQFTCADSNGCAAGNNKAEAILQGLLELVERDSIALWWYNRLTRPRVDFTNFADPYFQHLHNYYQTRHRDLWVLDITSDFNIPTFVAISRRVDQPAENILLGFGAHFDAQLAILRALTEVNQSLPADGAELSLSQDSYGYQERDRAEVTWWQLATVQNYPYLLPDPSAKPRTQADYSLYESDDLYSDVMAGVQLMQTKGMETLVLDQTRPDLGLHVVKVMVPGLRHWWPRFGQGRLYDVPVQMGWLNAPLAEEQLNPQPAFF
jgi:ribosomal protein S12 methylthiotransferase accessory factor